MELDSRNHILLEHEPAWERFRAAVLEFMGVEVSPAGEDPDKLGVWTRAQAIVFARDRGFRGNGGVR